MQLPDLVPSCTPPTISIAASTKGPEWFSSSTPYPRAKKKGLRHESEVLTQEHHHDRKKTSQTMNELLGQQIKAEDLKTRLQLLYHLADKQFLSFNNLCLGKLPPAIQKPRSATGITVKSRPTKQTRRFRASSLQHSPDYTALQTAFIMQSLTQARRGLLGKKVTSENFFSCLFIILCLEFQHGLGLIFCQPQGFQVKICQSKWQVLQSAKEKNCWLNLLGNKGTSTQLQPHLHWRRTEPSHCRIPHSYTEAAGSCCIWLCYSHRLDSSNPPSPVFSRGQLPSTM